jgi:hypothetical protein
MRSSRGRRTHIPPGARSSNPMNSGFRDRWDRNRTCNLRFWSTQRTVQRRLRLSKSPSNSQFLATHGPRASKNVQLVCSRFCRQLCVRPSARRRSSHELECTDFACTPQSDPPPLLRLDNFQRAGHLDLLVRPCASRRCPRPPMTHRSSQPRNQLLEEVDTWARLTCGWSMQGKEEGQALNALSASALVTQ